MSLLRKSRRKLSQDTLTRVQYSQADGDYLQVVQFGFRFGHWAYIDIVSKRQGWGWNSATGT